jgi:hypothetical protein
VLSQLAGRLAWNGSSSPASCFHASHPPGNVFLLFDGINPVSASDLALWLLMPSLACPQQPDVSELQQLLQPVAQHMMDASAAAENRRSQAFNQVKVVAEALQGLSWLAYTGPSCGECMQLASDRIDLKACALCAVEHVTPSVHPTCAYWMALGACLLHVWQPSFGARSHCLLHSSMQHTLFLSTRITHVNTPTTHTTKRVYRWC